MANAAPHPNEDSGPFLQAMRATPERVRISVALCTYNGSAYLLDQLKSIAAQTHKPAELVICDDQSADNTARVAADFAHHAPFPVSVNVNPQQLGVAGNFQRAISLCQSPLIATCDQDDLWLPKKLATLSQCFFENPSASLIFSDMALMTHEGNLTGKNQWQQLGFTAGDVSQFNVNGSAHAFEMLLRYNVVTGMAMMFRKSLFVAASPLNELFIHDQWMSLIAAATGRVIALPQPLVHYRQHANQKIGGASRNPIQQWRYARKHMGKDYVKKQLMMTQAVREKLQQPGLVLTNPLAISLLDEKIAHLQKRMELRESKLARWPGAIREMTTGHYRKFGHGWRSFTQDLFL